MTLDLWWESELLSVTLDLWWARNYSHAVTLDLWWVLELFSVILDSWYVSELISVTLDLWWVSELLSVTLDLWWVSELLSVTLDSWWVSELLSATVDPINNMNRNNPIYWWFAMVRISTVFWMSIWFPLKNYNFFHTLTDNMMNCFVTISHYFNDRWVPCWWHLSLEVTEGTHSVAYLSTLESLFGIFNQCQFINDTELYSHLNANANIILCRWWIWNNFISTRHDTGYIYIYNLD